MLGSRRLAWQCLWMLVLVYVSRNLVRVAELATRAHHHRSHLQQGRSEMSEVVVVFSLSDHGRSAQFSTTTYYYSPRIIRGWTIARLAATS